MLPRPVRYLIITLMIAVGLLAVYSIFNAGNPSNLLRFIFPDPEKDVTVAFISSLVVFVLGFFIFFDRDRQGFRELVRMNADQIKQSRARGLSDEAIADSILAAMGSTKGSTGGSTGGYRHNLARKKLLIALSEFNRD